MFRLFDQDQLNPCRLLSVCMVFTRHDVSECEYQLDLCFVELIIDMVGYRKGSSEWLMHVYVAMF